MMSGRRWRGYGQGVTGVIGKVVDGIEDGAALTAANLACPQPKLLRGDAKHSLTGGAAGAHD